MLYVAGIDDLGSETQKSEGWSYFVIQDSLAEEFSRDAAAILSQTNLKSFHGKNFTRRLKNEYRSFLVLVRDFLEKSNPSLFVTTLLNEQWKADYAGFIERTILHSLAGAGLDDTELLIASQSLAKPLVTLQRLTLSFPAGAEMRFEIDDHVDTRGLARLKLEKDGNAIDPLMPIAVTYRVHRSERFATAPALAEGKIAVMPDDKSFLIQAADVVGNFSVAFTRKKLGDLSKTTDLKAGIFYSIFGDILAECDFAANVEMSGSDLALKHNGAWTLTIA